MSGLWWTITMLSDHYCAEILAVSPEIDIHNTRCMSTQTIENAEVPSTVNGYLLHRPSGPAQGTENMFHIVHSKNPAGDINPLHRRPRKEGRYKLGVSTIVFQLRKCTWRSLVPAISISTISRPPLLRK
jgi:hypothetical protein